MLHGSWASSERNTEAANKVITGLRTTLQLEKHALAKVRSELRVDNVGMSASIVSRIEKLQEDLAIKNKLMDSLAQKTENFKVLSIKLSYATKRLEHMESEKAVFRSCVSDINQYLNNIIETRDSLLTVSIHQHHTEKLQPLFACSVNYRVFRKAMIFRKKGRRC